MAANRSLTKLLNIRVPIVVPPMAGASGGKLAANVSLAGGFGFISPAYNGLEKFRHELSDARSILNVPRSSILPIGIGFLGWRLEQPNSGALELLDAALEARPQAVWVSFGARLGHWIEYVRKADEHQNQGHKTVIFAQVNTVEEALVAIDEWNVDVLVAQGIESGGHGSGTSQKTSNLIAGVLAAAGDRCPPLLAAGGLANGKDVASMIRLGTSGAVLGTRFLLSHESTYSDEQKKALLAASEDSTVRSMAFDHARNTLGWPAGVDGRGIRNKLVRVFDTHGVEAVQAEYSEGLKTQDIEKTIVWAGTGVGSMNKIMSAGDIVKEISRELMDELST